MAAIAFNFPEVNISTLPAAGKSQLIYLIILLLILSTFSSLPFIKMDISVRSPGIIRPSSERTAIRSFVPGIVEKIFGREGQLIQQNSLILTLKNDFTGPKLLNIESELQEHAAFINDLELLTGGNLDNTNPEAALSSPLYRNQLHRYLYQARDQLASLRKVQKELVSDSSLYLDKVISTREFYNKNIEAEKLAAAYDVFKNDQLTNWQQDLSRLRAESGRLTSEKRQLLEEGKHFEVRAPVSGTLQALNTRYEGGFVAAGEVLCELSPETELIAECYVQTQDIGMLRINQVAKFQVDAFNYNYFGILAGRIISIDNDFSTFDNSPVFKVRCALDKKYLLLKNGFKGTLKKGLTLQARFIIARRSVAQLIFDQVDDWVNPVAFKSDL